MVPCTSTLQPQSISILLALAAVFHFDMWTSDVRQAYLQSAEPMARDIFIRSPVQEFESNPSQCLKLLKLLYGLCESGDLWHETLAKHQHEELGRKPLRSDPAQYTLIEDGLLKGLSRGYVDDLIRAGDKHFKQISQKTNDRFEMSEDQTLLCSFTGFSLSKNENGEVVQNQHEYLQKLEQLSLEVNYSQDFAHLDSGCQFVKKKSRLTDLYKWGLSSKQYSFTALATSCPATISTAFLIAAVMQLPSFCLTQTSPY